MSSSRSSPIAPIGFRPICASSPWSKSTFRLARFSENVFANEPGAIFSMKCPSTGLSISAHVSKRARYPKMVGIPASPPPERTAQPGMTARSRSLRGGPA